jgi:hypothetical protein
MSPGRVRLHGVSKNSRSEVPATLRAHWIFAIVLVCHVATGCATDQKIGAAQPVATPLRVWSEGVTNGVRFLYCTYGAGGTFGTAARVAFWSSLSAGKPWLNSRHVDPGNGFSLIPIVQGACPRDTVALGALQVGLAKPAARDVQPP